jgi:hypothetical protein
MNQDKFEKVVSSVSQVNHLMDEMTQKHNRLVQDTTKASKMNSLMDFFSGTDLGSKSEQTIYETVFKEQRHAS